MSNRYEEALKFANYKITLANQLEQIKFKFENNLIVADSGGFFKATLDFINQIHSNPTDIFIDIKGKPIKITNVEDFKQKINKAYIDSITEYHAEYTKLIKQRNVGGLINE